MKKFKYLVKVVSSVSDANNFTLLVAGIATLSGLTAGTVYFLSPSTAGSYTATEPSTTTQISKPVFIAVSTTQAVWINHRGIIL